MSLMHEVMKRFHDGRNRQQQMRGTAPAAQPPPFVARASQQMLKARSRGRKGAARSLLG